LTFSLRDERGSLLERSLELEAPLEGEGDEAQRVAATLAKTLGAAVRAASAQVVQSLAAPPAKVAPTAAPSP
jgi:hypothetical protein